MIRTLKKSMLLLFTLSLILPAAFGRESSTVSAAAPANKPFPQHTAYRSGVIKPDHVSQNQLDHDVKRLYDEWKDRYLKKNPKKSDQYYVFYNREGYSYPPEAVSSSEGHGYGMLTTVLMAGYDPDAKTYFDGLYRFYKAHPSVIDPALMAWQQVKDSKGNIIDNPDGGNDSATDGDMDIAYALLLADKQWGSSGSINYKAEGKKVIKAIMNKEVHKTEWTLKLGDWASDSHSKYGKATRPSDFMLSHLKAFQTASGDANWSKVIDKTYSVINTMYKTYSPSAGLLPDFVVKNGSTYEPAPAKFLDNEPTANTYNYNSCRTPWRITIDNLLTGDKRALDQLKTMNKWIKNKTGGKVKNIKAGYDLKGNVLKNNNYNDMAFTAPFAVSAMIDSSNQDWLNNLWKAMASSKTADGAYFDNSIRLLVMITVSGNWWTP